MLHEIGLPHALVGGLAVMVWSRPRHTAAVDFIFARRAIDVLPAHAQAMKRYRFDPSYTFKLYHESGIDIGSWNQPDADPIIARASKQMVADVDVAVVDVHDLVAMKLRAGRL